MGLRTYLDKRKQVFLIQLMLSRQTEQPNKIQWQTHLCGTFHENCTAYTLLSAKVQETFTWFFCKFFFKDCQARKDHLGHLVCLQPVKVISASAWLRLKASFILFS